ncbi:MAG: hypothetical protein Q4B54_00895, partial [Coriobacteriales bacterium]|nr:hypothetical protein [Coriobacteriales bacterium]
RVKGGLTEVKLFSHLDENDRCVADAPPWQATKVVLDGQACPRLLRLYRLMEPKENVHHSNGRCMQ